MGLPITLNDALYLQFKVAGNQWWNYSSGYTSNTSLWPQLSDVWTNGEGGGNFN